MCWFFFKVTKYRGQATSGSLCCLSFGDFHLSGQKGLAELGSSFQVDINHRVHLGRWTSVFPSGLLHCQPKGVTLVPSESSFFR